MAVNNNSRYKGSYIFLDSETNTSDGAIRYLSPFRDNIYKVELGDYQIIFEQGMRIDLLAEEYYGDSSLDWVIMDANPQYLTPYDIPVGVKINIPNPQRVMNRD